MQEASPAKLCTCWLFLALPPATAVEVAQASCYGIVPLRVGQCRRRTERLQLVCTLRAVYRRGLTFPLQERRQM